MVRSGGAGFLGALKHALMGRYISLTLQFRGVGSTLGPLRPLFATPVFNPVSIAGINAGPERDDWFLAGYALEDFMARFRRQSGSRPPAVRQSFRSGIQERDYVAAMANYLSEVPGSVPLLSPFEEEDRANGATFLQSVRLDNSVLKDAREWLTSLPQAVLYAYGTIRVAVASPQKLPWDRGFRFLFPLDAGLPVAGAPFVFIRSGPSPHSADGTEVNVFTESTVWLQEGRGLGGQVGKLEADRNLAQFAALAQQISKSPEMSLTDVQLSLDGGLFLREEDRIRTALSETLAVSGQT